MQSQVSVSVPPQLSEPVDPYDTWERLNGLGSYGRVNQEEFLIDTESLAFISSEENGPLGKSYIPVVVSGSTNSIDDGRAAELAQSVELSATEPALSVSYKEVDETYDAGVEFIMQRSQPAQQTPSYRTTEILPGASAQGEFIVPMAWSEDLPGSSGAILLTNDLVSNDAVVMPAGTQLTVELANASSSGMVDLRITSIILPDDSYGDMQVPVSALTILSGDGNVLVAKEISGSQRELNRITRNQAVLGAIGQIGSVLNRPNSSSSAIGPAGAISSTDYGSGSILGAVLEGAANTMINQRAAQNQQLAENLQDRSTILVIEQGTGVEIFVNQRVVL